MVEFFFADFSNEVKTVFRVLGFTGTTFEDFEETLKELNITSVRYSQMENGQVLISDPGFERETVAEDKYEIQEDEYIIYDIDFAYSNERKRCPYVSQSVIDFSEGVLDLENKTVWMLR
ncbi:hypothetical protein GGF42_003452 [Coemansia sp. RSA 2424]|nr:hypothetical protein GGF42_003452 [Coemansia sp. RSA 2424]